MANVNESKDIKEAEEKLNNEVLERIKMLMVKLRVGSVTAWARTLGMSQAVLDKKLRGVQSLNFEIIGKLLITYKNLSADWLLRGVGPCFRECDPVELDEQLKSMKTTILEAENKMLKDKIATQSSEIRQLSLLSDMKDENIRALSKKLNEQS